MSFFSCKILPIDVMHHMLIQQSKFENGYFTVPNLQNKIQ